MNKASMAIKHLHQTMRFTKKIYVIYILFAEYVLQIEPALNTIDVLK